jgi:hypothetical protein
MSFDRIPMSSDKDALSFDRIAISSDMYALSSDRMPMSCDKDALSFDKDAISFDMYAMSSDRMPMSCDKDALSFDRMPMSCDKDAISFDMYALSSDRMPMSFDKDAISFDMYALSFDRDNYSTVRNRELKIFGISCLRQQSGWRKEQQVWRHYNQVLFFILGFDGQTRHRSGSAHFHGYSGKRSYNRRGGSFGCRHILFYAVHVPIANHRVCIWHQQCFHLFF